MQTKEAIVSVQTKLKEYRDESKQWYDYIDGFGTEEELWADFGIWLASQSGRDFETLAKDLEEQCKHVEEMT